MDILSGVRKKLRNDWQNYGYCMYGDMNANSIPAHLKREPLTLSSNQNMTGPSVQGIPVFSVDF